MPPINPWKLAGYKASQSIACKVVAAKPGGYAVIIPKDNLPGFLQTDAKLKVGEEVLAQFVGVQNNQILLSARFTSSSFRQGNINVKQASPNIHESYQFRLKRATDLFMPPIDVSTSSTFKMKEHDLAWLIANLEGGKRTGCVKVSSAQKFSRSALLLYHGRAVGCIYGIKYMTETLSTEDSLQYMLQDLALPETEVTVYNLPEDVVLSMSALFVGSQIQREDNLNARSYMDYLCKWLADNKQTACLVLTLPTSAANCLVFITKGQFVGSFYVEEQKFSCDQSFVYKLLSSENKASLEASILPPESASQAGFGLSLSQAAKIKNS